jgi:hypothetical protein
MFTSSNNRANIKEKFIKYSNLFIELCGIYMLWIIIHYICSHIYVSWCTPLTIIGFILTPFIVPSPHCQALRWAIANGGTSITAMWFSLGTWITKKLIL